MIINSDEQTRDFHTEFPVCGPHGFTARKPDMSLDFTTVCHFIPCNCISVLENPGAEYWKTFGLSLRENLCRILGPKSSEWGTAVAQLLRCCATIRKSAGTIPDGVTGIFY